MNQNYITSLTMLHAMQIIKLKEDYIRLHVKKCPRWFPNKFYLYLLGKILIMEEFRK